MTETLDPLLRTRGVLDTTTLSKSVFYVLRALPPEDPKHFPEPDGYLNDGATPVWRTSTVRSWIEAQLEQSKRAKCRPASAKRARGASTSRGLIGQRAA